MKTFDKFNELTNNKYSFIGVKNLFVKKSTKELVLEVIWPHDTFDQITQEVKNEIFDAFSSLLCNDFWQMKIEFKRSYIDLNFAKQYVLEFFNENYVLILSQIRKHDIEIKEENDEINIKISLVASSIKHLEAKDAISQIKDYFARHTTNKINVEFVEKEFVESENSYNDLIDLTEFTQNLFKVDIIKPLIRKAPQSLPSFIKENLHPKKNAVVAGKIEDFKIHKSNKTNRIFYTFYLNDNTARINCKYFTRVETNGPLDDICDGSFALITGNISNDTYIQDLSLMVNSFTVCDIPNFENIKIPDESVPIDTVKQVELDDSYEYTAVFPEKYHDMEETSILDFSIEPKPQLKDNIFVVFDLEATGLNRYQDDNIIEIAAIKIINGKITEKFESLVYSEKKIPQEATNINNITNEMIKDAPKMKDVAFDFKKFVGDAYLVGHNIINYDVPLLNQNSRPFGIVFNNKIIDTYIVAKDNLFAGGPTGLKDYKLTSLADFYNIKMFNAHRAFDDVIANAKIFINFANNYNLHLN